MTTRGTVLTLTAMLSALALTVPAPVSSAPATAVTCDTFDVSPTFATDGTALCVGRRQERPDVPVSGVDVFLTTDKGRTWTRRAGTGLVVRPDNFWTQVVFSPRYSEDRTIYVQETQDGLYQTTDGGNTFTTADRLATTALASLPTIAPIPAAGDLLRNPLGSTASLAYASRVSAVITPPIHRPVAGAAKGSVAQFLIPPGFPATAALAVVTVAGTVATPMHQEIAACAADLVCNDTRLVLPDYFNVVHAGTSTVGGKPTTFVIAHAAIGPDARTSRAWQSTDGGLTFTRVPGLEAVLNRVTNYTASVAAGPRNTLWLKVDHSALSPSVPSAQLFTSGDRGSTWRRVAYERTLATPAGTLPRTNRNATRGSRSRVYVGSDGRIFVLGGFGPYVASSVFCSINLKNWRPTC